MAVCTTVIAISGMLILSGRLLIPVQPPYVITIPYGFHCLSRVRSCDGAHECDTIENCITGNQLYCTAQ